MRRHLILALTLSVLAAPSALLADTIPYSTPGTIPFTQTFTATTTGTLTLYFVTAGQTGAIDTLQFSDITTGFTSAFFFDNKVTTAGVTQSFAVTNGDVLAFSIHNSITGTTLSSSPAISIDGVNHAFSTPFAGGTITGSGAFIFPAGLYIGMEDLPANISDFNYNDEAFVVTQTAAVDILPVPEPATLSLMATGIVGAAGFARRKFSNR